MNTPFDLDHFLESLTQQPGVYRMLDEKEEVIYVGKAKNLKKRVSSYFQNKDVSPKQRALVARIHSIDVRVTHTEAEALLLECQLIKRYRPRYNVTLRDDKSYPGIYVSTQQPFPRVSFHRGKRHREGRHFGPYPSAAAVRECLKLLQKVFPIRQCRDSFFANRSRPCLEYQIQRCTAPCVGYIDEEAYAQDVHDTLMFLAGDGRELIDQLVCRMESAASVLNFEKAARHRDQIALIRTILEKQSVSGEQGDLDILAACRSGAEMCVHVATIRGGQLVGDRNHFPSSGDLSELADSFQSFIGQYYLDKQIPRELLINIPLLETHLLEEALSTQSGHQVKIVHQSRGQRARRVELASLNAKAALDLHLSSKATLLGRFEALSTALSLNAIPDRLECIDISHTQGALTVASCVVFDRLGPVKSDYRRFNIEGITAGDDYAAIEQTVERRYRRTVNGENRTPDILFIDGGKGQVDAAKRALTRVGLNDLRLIGVSKGPARKAGQETLICGDSGSSFMLPSHSASLHLIQQIRDEAHRFAITGHRQKRARQFKQSILEGIEGLGPKRRQLLLKQFGGIREIRKASVDSIANVPGISRQLAQKIHDQLNASD